MSERICGKPAGNRVIWPGDEPSPQCPEHVAAILRLGDVMGCPVHLLNAESGDVCRQKVQEAEDDLS